MVLDSTIEKTEWPELKKNINYPHLVVNRVEKKNKLQCHWHLPPRFFTEPILETKSEKKRKRK